MASDYLYVPLNNSRADGTDVVITVVQAVYGIPTILMMFFFLFFLGCSKKFTYSFYRLVQLDLFTNIICYLNSWLALRIDRFWFGLSVFQFLETLLPGTVTFSKYLVRWFMHMQFCSAAGLSLHRIITVLFPNKSERSWIWKHSYLFYGAISVAYSSLPELLLPGKTEYVEFVGGQLTRIVDRERGNKSINIIAGFSVAYFVLLIGICVTARWLVERQLKTISGPIIQAKKKLSIVAVVYGAIYSGILAWSLASVLNSVNKWFSINFFALTFASDLMTLALPYILLIFDSNIRTELVGMWKAVSGKKQVSPFYVASNTGIQS